MSSDPEKMHQSAEEAFSKVSSKIRKLGFAGGYMRYVDCKGDKVDVVVGREYEDLHAHFFTEDGKLVMQITNELKRDTPEEHKRVDWLEFAMMLGDMEQRFLSSIERITLADSRYAGKDVMLSTLPKIEFVKVKKKKAYFALVTEEDVCKFEDLDLNRFQIGAVIEPDGKELALIFTGKGRIASISVSRLEEMATELENAYSDKWYQMIGAC